MKSTTTAEHTKQVNTNMNTVGCMQSNTSNSDHTWSSKRYKLTTRMAHSGRNSNMVETIGPMVRACAYNRYTLRNVFAARCDM